MLSGVKHYIQRIKEGRLKELTAELLWMYAYVRRYWLLIGCYILLGASGSVLSLALRWSARTWWTLYITRE